MTHVTPPVMDDTSDDIATQVVTRETRHTTHVCGVTPETRVVSPHLPARPGTVWCHHICLSGPARVTSEMCMGINLELRPA